MRTKPFPEPSRISSRTRCRPNPRCSLASPCPLRTARRLQVGIPRMGPGSMMGPGPMMGRGPMMHGLGGFRDLQVAMPLPDGQWLSFATNLPDTGPAFSRQFLVSVPVRLLKGCFGSRAAAWSNYWPSYGDTASSIVLPCATRSDADAAPSLPVKLNHGTYFHAKASPIVASYLEVAQSLDRSTQ